ncbi:MAG: competence/damage-inducible protein A [Bacillus sp. (in: firmicutes)]
MNAEVIAVGSELLLGQIVNTNARFLSKQLAELGINTYFHTVVGDNPERFLSAVKTAENRSDILLFTGGLGPTKDDITKEILAKYLGVGLETDRKAMDSIQSYFDRTGRRLTENNKKQALVLQGSEVLPNEHGMAPGMVLSKNARLYMLLPGPPSEMEPMFLSYGHEQLYKRMAHIERIESHVMRFFGIGEAQLETEIEDLIEKQSNPTIAPLASDGEVTLRITAKHASIEEARKMIESLRQEIMERVGEFCYGSDETSLMKEVVKELTSRRMTITSAESLTGGLFQQELTSIPGAGNIFKGGIVSYTNEAKAKLLNIPDETIKHHGVVSHRCAEQMAENVRSRLDADIGISFTGVAGPDELEGHPVGTVFIGLAFKGSGVTSFQLKLGGSRERNRIQTVKHGCSLLLKELGEKDC